MSNICVELFIISISASAVGKEANRTLQKPNSDCRNIMANTHNLQLMHLKNCGVEIRQVKAVLTY